MAMFRQMTERCRICRGLRADGIAGHSGHEVPFVIGAFAGNLDLVGT